MTQNTIDLFPGHFPRTRMRRQRSCTWSRSLIQETDLKPSDLIWPVFLREESIDATCQKLPHVTRFTIPELLDTLAEAISFGIQAIMLFPVVEADKRDDQATEAFNENGLVCAALTALKARYPDLVIITDVALDPYTIHGQDGIVTGHIIDNDKTLEALKAHAIVQAKAGTDVIAPSEMMDGRIGVLRDHLDAHGFTDVQLMSYGAKYASCFYGPFRNAVKSDALLGTADKRTYQMDPANSDEALREVALDLREGADSIIIKPGLPYLDIIYRIKETFKAPTIAFQVSGEFAMLKAAADQDLLSYHHALMEALTCFKRAGADGIITYGALDAARILTQTQTDTVQKTG